MAKYEVAHGIVLKQGKSYHKGAEIELTDTEVKGLGGNVKALSVKKAEKAVETGEKSYADMTMDELKSLVGDNEVEGTGKNGAIKKEDYIKALEK